MTMQTPYTFVPSVTLTSLLADAGKNMKTRLALQGRAYVIHTSKSIISGENPPKMRLEQKYTQPLNKTLKLRIK